MIEAIIKSLESVFDGQDWVKVYGGLVDTWTRDLDTDPPSQESFPVTWGESREGCDSDCQNKLLPDDTKKNILFWVQTSDAVSGPVPANISRSGRPVQITQNARLIVWVNFKGCQDCSQASFMAYVDHLRQLFDGRKFSLTEPVPLRGTMRVAGIPTRDHKEVFAPWSFGTNQLLFVYPFDFFGLDFTFTWIQNQSCPAIPTC